MNNKIEQKLGDLFQGLRESKGSPSPFLKTRILARVEENRRNNKLLFFYKSVTGFCLAILLVITINSQFSTESMLIGKNYVVNVDLKEVSETNISFAKIILPKNIVFVSKNNPSLSSKRELSIDWEYLAQNRRLPIVIQGIQSGKMVVEVRFYDKKNKLIRTKKVKLNFS